MKVRLFLLSTLRLIRGLGFTVRAKKQRKTLGWGEARQKASGEGKPCRRAGSGWGKKDTSDLPCIFPLFSILGTFILVLQEAPQWLLPSQPFDAQVLLPSPTPLHSTRQAEEEGGFRYQPLGYHYRILCLENKHNCHSRSRVKRGTKGYSLLMYPALQMNSPHLFSYPASPSCQQMPPLPPETKAAVT